MKFHFQFIFVAVVMMLILVGCSNELTVEKAVLSSPDEITLKAFENEEDLEIISKMVNTAIKQPGIVDISEPNYHLSVSYSDESTVVYYLWIGDADEIGLLMYASDTHYVYHIKDEWMKALREIMPVE